MNRLTPKQDVYGQELYHCHTQGKGLEIIERDDGLIDVGDASLYFTRPKDWHPAMRQALKLAGGRVLDIGAGAGRHSLYMQEKGLDVVATDNSPLALKVCRLRGVKKTRLAGIEELGPRLGKFDTIIMLGNNFGLLGGFTRGRRILRRLAGMTSPAARIIAETLDPYQTKSPVHLAYHRRNRARGRMAGQVRIRVRHRNLASPWFDYLFVSRPELYRLIAGTGWEVERLIDGTGPIYIVVLKKTGQA